MFLVNAIKDRISVKLEKPNPLFEKWLTQWRDEARQKQSKMEHCYNTALKNLKLYPLPFETGRDCKILKGFGDKLCSMLDERLAIHRSNNIEDDIVAPEIKRRKSTNNKVYVPSVNSGGYTILRILYEKSLEGGYKGYLTKDEIIQAGQKYSDKSFTKPDPGTRYTAWSSMSTLIQKYLVIKKSCPAKYQLTEQGAELAEKLYIESITNIDTNTNGNDLHLEEAAGAVSAITNKPKRQNTLKQPSLERHASSSSTASTESTKAEEYFILCPDSFEIVLLVDTQEITGVKHQNDVILGELNNLGVRHEVRNLKVGDYVWIARDLIEKKNEAVLPFIIERKRMDDLGHSIKDGRYHEQKFRLKQCGLSNIIYLIEHFGDERHLGLPIRTLHQAIANTQIQDGFSIKITDSSRGTAEYLKCLTNLITHKYKSKTLISCPKENLSDEGLDSDLISVMTFSEFNKHSIKNKQIKVKDFFAKLLLQIKGVSVDRALAITEKYPTPQLLLMAYEEEPKEVGEKLLAKIQYGNLKKYIGPVLSRTIYQLFSNQTL